MLSHHRRIESATTKSTGTYHKANEGTITWSTDQLSNTTGTYTFDNITDVTADNEAYPLLTETFKGATKDGATLDTPYLVGNDYASESLDDVADNVGWSGIGLAYAGNMVGCGQDMGMSQLESPTFDASHNNGVFNVSFNCYGTPGEMMVVQNAEISYQYVSLKEGVTNYNLTFEDGADNTCLVFYVMNGTPFLIGDVKVTQSMKAGEQIRTCLATSPWIAETSYFFSNAVADGEDKIGYTVQARYKRDLTWYYSPLSDVQIVEDKSGVDDIQIDNACSISLNGRMLTVEADAAENVAVYTINGTTLAAHSGNISMTLPDKGVNNQFHQFVPSQVLHAMGRDSLFNFLIYKQF